MPRVILIFGFLVAVFIGLLVFSGYLAHRKDQSAQTSVTIPVSSTSPDNSQSAFYSATNSAVQSQGFAVTSTTPNNNDTNVALDSPVLFSFNRSFDSSSSAVQFTPDTQFVMSSNSNGVTVLPNPALQPNTQYKVTVQVPSQNYSYTLSFTTINASPSPSASASASPQ